MPYSRLKKRLTAVNTMPKITLAKYAGFCFGVKHAVDTVEKLLNENPNTRIYTLGKLIHNDFIVDGFAARGVKIIDEKDIDRIADESDDGTHTYVVIRAPHTAGNADLFHYLNHRR